MKSILTRRGLLALVPAATAAGVAVDLPASARVAEIPFPRPDGARTYTARFWGFVQKVRETMDGNPVEGEPPSRWALLPGVVEEVGPIEVEGYEAMYLSSEIRGLKVFGRDAWGTPRVVAYRVVPEGASADGGPPGERDVSRWIGLEAPAGPGRPAWLKVSVLT